jgi:hypothetical protein
MQFGFSALEWRAMSDEQRIELSRGEFGRRMTEQAARHVAAFWWIEPAPTSPFLICVGHPQPRNGSAFFIAIGDAMFCVTAAHVYRGYLDAKAKHPGLQCRLGEGSFVFDAERRICSIGKSVDIAIFRITPDEVRAIDKEPVVHSTESWPPHHPFSGQQAKIVGFPGVSRLWITEQAISFGVYCGSPSVGSAGDRRITFPFDRTSWVDCMGLGLPPEGMDLGGMSGGPVLFLTEQNRDWSFNIGGVISEMPGGKGYELVVAEPVHFITAEGLVNERSWPNRQYIPAHAPFAKAS